MIDSSVFQSNYSFSGTCAITPSFRSRLCTYVVGAICMHQRVLVPKGGKKESLRICKSETGPVRGNPYIHPRYILHTTYINTERGQDESDFDVERKCDLSSNSNAVDRASTEYV